ncbi:ABC transporter ATP-binding protein [Lactobacillus sp. DCY120]|uniref:ABC transporter ATP-binding protein n=1 Tax=Bombilactobacillus apium TaxID=2675299 RepID=A0A850QZ42_9LACO|nr:ABC transporter ATP-binding protein [Bombilactobacillus apium]NVY95963.1 ABC transporter ATP-binding protein [Bombilactobacillus apium]
MTVIVEVQKLGKTYDVNSASPTVALKELSFAVQAGEFVGIMGASGSGKSTLLNILTSIDTPTSGRVLIDQQDLSEFSERQLASFRSQRMGFIFQDFSLLDNMTALENIALPLSLQGVKTEQIRPRVEDLGQKLGIAKVLDHCPNALSGGQKQRVAAARALVNQPALLLGDEPTGALDSKSATDFLDMLQTINTKQQVAIILVTHDPYAASYCQRILFTKDGQIQQQLPRAQQEKE